MGMLKNQWSRQRYVCVGLDPEFNNLPEMFRQRETSTAISDFCRSIVDATRDVACAYRPDITLFEQNGPRGIAALRDIISHIYTVAPDVPVILSPTSTARVDTDFNSWKAHAVTVNPYLGRNSIQPFLDCKDKGTFVVCRTSNAGASEFQDLIVGDHPLYIRVARVVNEEWNVNGNCGLLVEATKQEELRAIRKSAGELPILITGLDGQGADLPHLIEDGFTPDGGLLINLSRTVLYASDSHGFADAANMAVQRMNKIIMESRETVAARKETLRREGVENPSVAAP